MKSTRPRLIFQIGLKLALCLLSLELLALSGQAQNCAGGTQDCECPPYHDIWFGQDYKYLWSWHPGHDVPVFIDDRFNEIDRGQLFRGALNWGSLDPASPTMKHRGSTPVNFLRELKTAVPVKRRFTPAP